MGGGVDQDGGVGLPVWVADRCAEACAGVFGLGGPEEARAWLDELIVRRGVVSNQVVGRRSPSRYFLVVEGLLLLPLVAEADRWVAVNCLVFPGVTPVSGSRLSR